MGVYQIGTAVTITETFSLLGVPTSPTTVTFVVQDPDGNETTYVNGDPEVSNPLPGVFVLELPPATVPGLWLYTVAGTGAVIASGGGDFTVLQSAINPVETIQPQPGPCTPWVDCGDIQAVCSVPDADVAALAGVAAAASQMLFQLSGRQFTGVCTQTVRPFQDGCGCWPWIVAPASPGVPQLPVGWGYWGTYGWGWGYEGCGGVNGCGVLSRALLPGYPVTSVTEVKIDGVAVDPATYRLDGWRWLTRTDDGFWPACQDLSRDDSQERTWSVTCTTGQPAPVLGQMAAAQLGCELFLASIGGDCKLPSGAVQVNRQGIQVQLAPYRSWGQINGQWATGLNLVDAFLSTYNPAARRRPAAIWSPDAPEYAQRLGAGSGS